MKEFNVNFSLGTGFSIQCNVSAYNKKEAINFAWSGLVHLHYPASLLTAEEKAECEELRGVFA